MTRLDQQVAGAEGAKAKVESQETEMAKPQETEVNGWMNSEGHRANILNGKFDTIGIGQVGILPDVNVCQR